MVYYSTLRRSPTLGEADERVYGFAVAHGGLGAPTTDREWGLGARGPLWGWGRNPQDPAVSPLARLHTPHTPHTSHTLFLNFEF
ncbi:hypothetical protein NIES592_23060 [Fischerella major NIES-592]|uniref:Uncharacterized protein n=1 Tax=Fischerella major NIES-592 TaxID=210994 RepID=A0A1U7GT36_9CYAN|nr:hypothetical protein NIES592_23060 [Fischerella major NIES-592]